MDGAQDELPVARRRLFNRVAGSDYDALVERCSTLTLGFRAAQSEILALKQQAQATREQMAALQAAHEARESRIADALGDAAAVADGLAFAARELAAFALPDGPNADASHVELVLRRLFPRIIAGVRVGVLGDLPADEAQALRGTSSGMRTWEADRLTAAGERPLASSAARVHDVVVHAHYEADVFADGDLPGIVEHICLALAVSLAAQRLAHEQAGERGRFSMLAREEELMRLRALRASQGVEMANVQLNFDPHAVTTLCVQYGRPAWAGLLFDVAGRLDLLARDNGGEAFEVESAIYCLVPADRVDCMRSAVQELAAALDVAATVTVS